jgi:hypothetical protein
MGFSWPSGGDGPLQPERDFAVFDRLSELIEFLDLLHVGACKCCREVDDAKCGSSIRTRDIRLLALVLDDGNLAVALCYGIPNLLEPLDAPLARGGHNVLFS